MLSTVQNGSNLSSDGSTAVYRTVLRYSVAIIGWLPVMNNTTCYRQLLLLLKKFQKKKTRGFLVRYLTLPRWRSSTAQYYAVTLRSQRYLWCSITELLSYLQVMLSTVQNGSNLSSDGSTAVYRTVLRYSVAANGWSPVTNITTGYWQVLLPQRNSKKITRKFLVMVLDFTAAKIQRGSTTAKYCLVLSLYLPVSVVLAAARVATITLDRNLQCAARSNWMENVPPIGGSGRRRMRKGARKGKGTWVPVRTADSLFLLCLSFRRSLPTFSFSLLLAASGDRPGGGRGSYCVPPAD
jgi:hypothetical protein